MIDKMDRLKQSKNNDKHLTTKTTTHISTYNKNYTDLKISEKKQLLKQSNKKTISQLSYVGSHGFNIFSLIILILISVSLIRILKGGAGEIVSLGSLLDLLRDAPQISSSVLQFTEKLQIVFDWGIFNFLRDFINGFVDVVSVLTWLCASVVDLLIYIFYFIRWIFV